MPQKNIFNICDKINVPWQFNKGHNENNIIVVGQWTIAENLPLQVYLCNNIDKNHFDNLP